MHVYVDKMSLIRDSKDKFYLFSQEHGDQVNRPAEGMMSFTVISLFCWHFSNYNVQYSPSVPCHPHVLGLAEVATWLSGYFVFEVTT